jgi:lipopolysaccharide/colanic/teichoic acid biosynthesis glycosyltransferase
VLTSTLQDHACAPRSPGFDEAAIDFDEHVCRLSSRRWQSAGKRLLDCGVALFLLILFSPLLVVAAVAVKLSSAGPVLFRQEREGRGGRRFYMLKFRSMRICGTAEVDAYQAALAARGTLIKMRQDPRVTAVGRWLRATSIDELPQLWNVLSGDMSLVGPRPLLPFMLEPHPEFRRVRALVRPGITGLWQLRDRNNNNTAAAMLPHDLEYLRGFSLKQDLVILARTVPAVLTGRGAF